MTTTQVVVALVTTILMLILGIKTKSKIIFTVLLVVSLSLWQLLDNVVKLTQQALDGLGTKTGWWEPFSIQTGLGGWAPVRGHGTARAQDAKPCRPVHLGRRRHVRTRPRRGSRGDGQLDQRHDPGVGRQDQDLLLI